MTDPTPTEIANPPVADFAAEVAAFDAEAEVDRWQGPRHRMTFRVLGAGPSTLVLCPGIASTYRGYAPLLRRLASKYRTVVFDYPGDHPDDGANLRRITHENLVDDLFGLLDHLGTDSAGLVGPSFGSTLVLRALDRAPGRFPRAVVQGGFAHRRFTSPERLALILGRQFPGHVGSLPFQGPIVSLTNKRHFRGDLAAHWTHYLQQNALTRLAPLAHRLDLVARLDLRPRLPEIHDAVLLLQGAEDRIVPRRQFDTLRAGLPHATAALLPRAGHQLHYTHAAEMAAWVDTFLANGHLGGAVAGPLQFPSTPTPPTGRGPRPD